MITHAALLRQLRTPRGRKGDITLPHDDSLRLCAVPGGDGATTYTTTTTTTATPTATGGSLMEATGTTGTTQRRLRHDIHSGQSPWQGDMSFFLSTGEPLLALDNATDTRLTNDPHDIVTRDTVTNTALCPRRNAPQGRTQMRDGRCPPQLNVLEV